MKRLTLILGTTLAAALLSWASPAPADEPAGDTVTLHYFRPDGSYDGWGIHTWESFQDPKEAADEFAPKPMSDRPVNKMTWFAPIMPTGKDDFGISWTLAAKEYGNGRVNYIIHKGDKKDQCNQDKYWMIKDSKEAWVVAGDCKVYLTKEEALKSPKAKK